jgi:hypothetical protein
MSGAFCVHCDMVLSLRERSEGKCDSCGQKLPASASPAPARTTVPAEPVEPETQPRPGFWKTFGLVMLCSVICVPIAFLVFGPKVGGSTIAAMGAGLAYGIIGTGKKKPQPS